MNPKVVAVVSIGVLALLSLPLLLANKITLSNYEEIEMGMSYDDVKGILGEGTPIEEVDIAKLAELPAGVPIPDKAQLKQMMDAIGLSVYIWEKDEDTVVSVTLLKGKTVAKAQRGLDEQPSQEVDREALRSLPGMPAFGR